MKNDSALVRFDWAVKRLLRNKSNFVVLEGFLSTLLGQETVSYTHLLRNIPVRPTMHNNYILTFLRLKTRYCLASQ